ncbi:PH domain-containing protein [Kitasatospora sp. NPDC091207]|uniref:PH domain-containing protein n=1 Tax=Kitasatospora sp. NPDC091207 TaxID=3364083 RepID=UPI0037FCA0D5
MGEQELPREYRATWGRVGPVLLVLGLKTALMLFITWVEDFPLWVKQLATAAVLLLDIVVVACVPRSGTFVDRAGIRVRGFFRLRRLAWSEIEDIRVQSMRGSAPDDDPPTVIAYAYRSTGRRVLLVHLNDQHLESPLHVEREVEVLRAAWAELRDPSAAPHAVPHASSS